MKLNSAGILKFLQSIKIRYVLLVAGFACLILSFIVISRERSTSNYQDVLILWAIYTAVILSLSFLLSAMEVQIPPGLAGVIYFQKFALKAVPGPASLHGFTSFHRIDIVPLVQQPLDLRLDCVTMDRIKISVVVSVYYTIRVDSLVAHLNHWIDIVGDIKRHACFKLLQEYSACELMNVSTFVPQVTRKLTTFINNPSHNRDNFDINQILMIDIKYPLEVMRSAEALARARNELEIARTKAQARLLELTPETDARIDELQKMDATLKTVSKETLEYVESHTVLDHWSKK